MKYYLIVGEASGDLHASHLMRSLADHDASAEFRFFGGDLMSAVGGERVKHYRELAYMGFVPVLLHLRTIFRNMALCKRDIVGWQPDAVILVDYPGFNLDIAKYLRAHTQIPVFYYISPKIWAWKEWRIKAIRRDVDELFSILPFEIDFFERKHHFPIHYVGNPTADEVAEFRTNYKETREEFLRRNHLADLPIVALLAGSRRQEIKDNLPAMLAAAKRLVYDDGRLSAGNERYQVVVAGAPGIEQTYYARFLNEPWMHIVHGETYALLSHAAVAAVTSGTATLETALFGVPQVVCYKTPLPKLIAFLRRRLLNVRFISLVNLIVDREAVRELVADTFSVDNIFNELQQLLFDDSKRQQLHADYCSLAERLGNNRAPEKAATTMIEILQRRQKQV